MGKTETINPRHGALRRRTTMLRKLTLALVAAASLSAMALAPTAASAGGGGFGGGFGGFHHHHWGHGFGIGFIGGGDACAPSTSADIDPTRRFSQFNKPRSPRAAGVLLFAARFGHPVPSNGPCCCIATFRPQSESII
jgi:hypothetical protein